MSSIDLYTRAYDGIIGQSHPTRLDDGDAEWMSEIFRDAVAHNKAEARAALTRIGYWTLVVTDDAEDFLGAAVAAFRGFRDMHQHVEDVCRIQQLGARLCVTGFEEGE